MPNKKYFAFVQIYIYIYIYRIYEGNDYDKIYEVLSTLKNEKIEKKIIP